MTPRYICRVTVECSRLTVGCVSLLLVGLLAGADEPPKDAGWMLELKLPGQGAAAYGTEETTAMADVRFAREVRQRYPHLHYSSRLARAAEAYASSISLDSPSPLPAPFLENTLWWVGAIYSDASVSIVNTTEASEIDLWSQLSRTLHQHTETRFTHVGVGRVAGDREPFRWRWALILARQRISLAPVNRTAPVGRSIALHFTLDGELSRPEVAALSPDGTLVRLWPEESDGVWRLYLPQPAVVGQYWVEILADDTFGPGVAALFPLHIGIEPTPMWRGPRRPEEGWISEAEDAEQLMLVLLNEARRHHHLPPLKTDAMLTAIARKHSRAMLTTGFLGHLAPDGSNHGSRIQQAAYRARRTAENISRAASIFDAHNSLLRSPVHRANVLSPSFRRVGIGIAFGRDSRGGRVIYVTQEFAEPLP